MENPGKAELRQTYLEIRNRLDPTERQRASSAIRDRVIASAVWQDAGTILIYLAHAREVDTQKILETALEQNKRLAVPVVDRPKKEMTFSELTSLGDLQPGPYEGILQPPAELRVEVDPSEIELVVVPGVVFDRTGGRIGMGGGYFDKSFPKMKQAYRLGLAFSQQIHLQNLPLHAHDQAMQAIATENEWIQIAQDPIEEER